MGSIAEAVSARSWADKIQLGAITLSNRTVMAAMTRCRGNPKEGIATALHAEYYAQRAGAGMILTECSTFSDKSDAYPGAANLFTNEQEAGWKQVIHAVHLKGGRIFWQAYHGGRAVKSEVSGRQPWAPSAVPIKKADGTFEETPKAMTEADIQTVIADFELGVVRAKRAGFDGIEIHGANGYLVDQFLRSNTNKRTDRYGGSVINRCRLAIEMVEIASRHFPKEQVGIKVSPTGRFNDMFDVNPLETYGTLLTELSKLGTGFVEIVEPSKKGFGGPAPEVPEDKQVNGSSVKALRSHFKGLLIANMEFTPETGLAYIQGGHADMISFARSYMCNPDLAERIIHGWPISDKLDYSKAYGGGADGYTTYPVHAPA